MKKEIQAMLKSLKTKKSILEVVKKFSTKDLTEEGQAIIKYLIDLFSADMKDMTLTEMKNEVLTLVQNNAFKDMTKATVLFENAIKPTKKVKSPKTQEKTLDNKEKTPKTQEKPKELTQDEIFQLCGYRYVYPIFPESFESPVLEGKTFHRVEEDDPMKIQKMYDDMLEGKGNDLVVAMYFPEYERDYDIDPHGLNFNNIPKKQLLKKYGGHYPNNLDVQSIVHFDGGTKYLVSVSAYTGLPYSISCVEQLFVTNNKLKCRVSQNGLDYQIYQIR